MRIFLVYLRVFFFFVPNLRFPTYTQSWKSNSLYSFAERVKRKNTNNQCKLPLTISAQYGLISQTQFFDRQIASKDMSNYYLLFNGEFAYNKSYSNDYPWGTIKRLDKHDFGALSTLYFCFRPYEHVNSDFLVHYFETSKWHKGISNIAGEGARNHGLLNMSVDDFFATKHFLPSCEEQEKIATFLNLISERIDTQSKIIEDLETQKKTISNIVFNKKPLLEIKLVDLYKYGKAGGTPSSNNKSYYGGDIPFLSIADMTEQGKFIGYTEKTLSIDGLNNSSAWLVPENSLIMSMYASVGLVAINLIPISTSQAMFSMVIEDQNMLEYIYYYLCFFKEKRIYRLLETGTQSNINAEMVKNILIPIYSEAESEAIINLLKKCDQKIQKEKDILSAYKKQKAYLLREMFI